MKLLPSDGKTNPAGASPILRDAHELSRAAEARLVRHHEALGMPWSPPGPRDLSHGPRTDLFHLDTHDEAVIQPCMSEAEGWRLRHTWERHTALRHGAAVLYRRALEGVLAIAEHGMRRRGWQLAAKDTASSHLAGAAWTKEGEGVALQVWIDSGLPRRLLAPLEEESDLDNAWRRHGIRVVARLRAASKADNPGRLQLADALAEGVWRQEDRESLAKPRWAAGIVLEEPRHIEERIVDLPTLFFRREIADGSLPRALRLQLEKLRGGVIFREVLEERPDELALPVGTMLRPEGTWDRIRTTRPCQSANGIPQLEPGEILLREPESAILLSPRTPRECRLAAGDLLPERLALMGWRDVATDRGERLFEAAVETERFEELG